MLNLANMRPGETVIMVIKRHWIVFALLGVYFFVGVKLSLILLRIFGATAFTGVLLVGFWIPFLMFLYVEWLNHELDMYVVTNNRIIGVEQVSFLNRTVTECNLAQVQEVNSETKGFFANILNYGTVLIQTAGSATTLKMDFAPDALQRARKLLNIVDDYRDVHHSVAQFRGNKSGDKEVDGK